MRFLLVALLLVTACARTEPFPAFGENTPEDLRALATSVLATAAEAFPDRRDCFDGLVVSGAWELDDRARYIPDRREVVVRIPATAGQLEVSLVHELGHHLESTCPPGEAVEAAFREAQGLASETGWYAGDSWETTPSEHWASAIVVHVLGRVDTQARIAISPGAVDVVAAWAGMP